MGLCGIKFYIPRKSWHDILGRIVAYEEGVNKDLFPQDSLYAAVGVNPCSTREVCGTGHYNVCESPFRYFQGPEAPGVTKSIRKFLLEILPPFQLECLPLWQPQPLYFFCKFPRRLFWIYSDYMATKRFCNLYGIDTQTSKSND